MQWYCLGMPLSQMTTEENINSYSDSADNMRNYLAKFKVSRKIRYVETPLPPDIQK